jgi:hypothetical protein
MKKEESLRILKEMSTKKDGAEPRDENERLMIKEIKRMDANGKIVWTSSD